MKFVENQKYTLPVVEMGVLIDRGRPYLTVEHEGNNYQVQAYKFQKAAPPRELQCFYKGGQLKQDLEWVLPQVYRQGEIYTFRVLSERYNGMQTLIDDNEGINHRMPTSASAPLKRGGMVKCRVDGFEPGYLKLTVIDDGNDRLLTVYTPEEISGLVIKHRPEARLLRRIFRNNETLAPALTQARAGNPRWVLTLIEIVENELPGWVTMRYPRQIRLIEAFIEICTRLIENSPYLADFGERERADARVRISRTITHAGDYVEALTLKEQGTAEEFVVSVVDSLSTTGYIYQPERKMRIVMALFGIEPVWVRTYINDIFKVILARHADRSFMELFSQAFIEMLDIFISNENRFSGYADNSALRELVTAIAMQLLLTTDIDFPRWGLYRAMLYRYASLFNKGNVTNSRRLIKKAFDSLLDRCDSRLEFSWGDLENITILCTTRLTADTEGEGAMVSAVFDGGGISLRMVDSDIVISRSDNPSTARNVLPAKFFPDRDIKIILPGRLEERISSDEHNMGRIRRMWKEALAALLEKNVRERHVASRKQSPAIGDEVTVRVTGRRAESFPPEFNCVIEDPIYEGRGVIGIVDIVGYHVNADDYTFMAQEGEYLLLKAEVTGIDEDDETLRFSMRSRLSTFIYETANRFKNNRETLQGIITDTERNAKFYLGLADDGFTFSIPKQEYPGLSKSTVVEFTINFAERDRSKPDTNIIVNASLSKVLDICEKQSDYCEQAMNHLLYDYAEGNTYVSADGEIVETDMREADMFLDNEDVNEVIRLVDCLSQLHPENQAVTYGYIAVAHILAVMVSDAAAERNFALRMDLIKAISDFADTGRVDAAKVRDLSARVENQGIDPAVNHLMVQLKVLSLLGMPWDECEYLHDVALRSETLSLVSLARQVLAYNLLQGIHQTDTERRNLKKEIFRTLNLRPASTDAVIPHESDVVELKTSLIYPAGARMHADETRQVAEIMEEICGFLNTAGGTIYIGVRDNGDISGLHEDFRYLNDSFEDYDIVDVQDKFRVHFANGVTRHFGSTNRGVNLSAEHIRGDFDYVNGKWIFIVSVKPSATAVAMTDGNMFVRNGSTNRRIPSETERRLFAENRRREYGADSVSVAGEI